MRIIWAAILLITSLVPGFAQKSRAPKPSLGIRADILLRVIAAEDERRWNNDLAALLAGKDARVRKRAVLAAGRIGDEHALPVLVDLLRGADDADVRQMVAFALGEIESPEGAEVLVVLLDDTREPGEVRARAVEALGKIAAALPESERERKRAWGKAILNALEFEAGRRSSPDRLTILLGLTATLRAKPDGAGPVIIRFLGYSDPRIVADTLNALARLRLKDGNDKARQLLVKDGDPVVRANAARVLGATEDKEAFDALLDRALHDDDLRVRVSAIRALGNLKDARAATPLLDRAQSIFKADRLSVTGRPSESNERLEIATSLGRILERSKNERALQWLRDFRLSVGQTAPEIDLALARIDPSGYSKESLDEQLMERNKQIGGPWWLLQSSSVQGLAEANRLGGFSDQGSRAVLLILKMSIMTARTPTEAIPDVLRSYATFKPDDLGDVLSGNLTHSDVIVRATAAELVAQGAPNEKASRALIEALKAELAKAEKGEMNDAALAMLDALAKQKNAAANEAIKTALYSSDHLIRRKAVALLKANGVGDFSDRIGTVKTSNTEADYRRAIGRIDKNVTAMVETSKGAFTIEFLSEEAPLTVDNFIQLARKGFFNGQTIPRVVPNFVIQGGDPRGDTNGGPGYQIRCEINEVPYERGAVGMALSGKDTGGSQWFVTHSPQPHLDGGYTIFGRVIRGMEVVDNIARGDTIRRVIVNEL